MISFDTQLNNFLQNIFLEKSKADLLKKYVGKYDNNNVEKTFT